MTNLRWLLQTASARLGQDDSCCIQTGNVPYQWLGAKRQMTTPVFDKAETLIPYAKAALLLHRRLASLSHQMPKFSLSIDLEKTECYQKNESVPKWMQSVCTLDMTHFWCCVQHTQQVTTCSRQMAIWRECVMMQTITSSLFMKLDESLISSFNSAANSFHGI